MPSICEKVDSLGWLCILATTSGVSVCGNAKPNNSTKKRTHKSISTKHEACLN